MTTRKFVLPNIVLFLLLTICSVAPAADPPAAAMTAAASGPVCISGVYPHLAVFNSLVTDEGQTYGSGGECGIGAVVPWAGKLWLLT